MNAEDKITVVSPEGQVCRAFVTAAHPERFDWLAPGIPPYGLSGDYRLDSEGVWWTRGWIGRRARAALAATWALVVSL